MPYKPFALSAKVIVLDGEGRCLLLKRSMISKGNPGKWDLPGGKVDAGEDLEYTGWGWFFRLVETSLGTEKFQRFIGRYLVERKGKPEFLPAQTQETIESITSEEPE